VTYFFGPPFINIPYSGADSIWYEGTRAPIFTHGWARLITSYDLCITNPAVGYTTSVRK